MEFIMYNFSSVTIDFFLTWRSLSNFEILNDLENAVEIHPKSATLQPGRGKQFKVILTPNQVGIYLLAVQYTVKLTTRSESTVATFSKARTICTLKFTCQLSTLQVM